MNPNSGSVPTEQATTCPLCETNVDPGGDHLMIGTPTGHASAHRECLLRSVMGGIGHLTDHAHWCLTVHDPDGGHTYRESALLVDQWVTDHA